MKFFLNQVILHVFFVSLLGTACGKKDDLQPPARGGNEMIRPNATPGNSGSFSNGPYGSVSGNAKLYAADGRYQLALENFTSSSGPDLKVYLSQELSPMNFINLGSLRSFTGNQVYSVPDGSNPETYKYVLIYCKQYSHLFGSAELK